METIQIEENWLRSEMDFKTVELIRLGADVRSITFQLDRLKNDFWPTDKAN
jgi:hypothetical protein